MFKMTAAHPRLPIPSYARVTNLRNGKQVIVRINDRGPFHASRIIDMSYTAALKLGFIQIGSAELEVERILPDEIARMQEDKRRKGALATTKESTDPMTRLASGSAPPVAAETGGIFLQFGAYAQVHNADAMRIRLLAGWPQDLPEPVVVQMGGLYRLHSGPFTSRETAKTAADLLKEVSQIQTSIVQK
jgi:rare lipoprotein A